MIINNIMQFPLFLSKNSKPILLLVALTVFILAFRDILVTITSQWTGAESAGTNHGFLVLACTIYLLYLKKDQFNLLTPAPQTIGFIPVVLLVVIFFLAELTEIQAVQMLVLPLLILASIFTVLGKQYLKVAFVPVVILIFALPIWKPALPILQDITTLVTEFNLNVLGRPVYVVGSYIHVTGGTFLIEEACSGLRFILISIILSLINSDLNSHSRVQATALLATAVGLAFIANWLRVIIIVVIGDSTNMQHSLVNDHVNFGWVVFLFVVLIPYLLISRLVPQHAVPAKQTAVEGKRVAFRPYFVLTLLAIIAVPILGNGHRFIQQQAIGEIEIPSAFANWDATNNIAGSNAWRPHYKNATKELFKSYSARSGVKVDLNIYHYAEQKQGAELINVENTIADGKSWSVIPASESQYLMPGNKNITSVNAVEIINISNQKRLIWYWYDIGGYITSNQYFAKLFQILAQLQGKNYANLVAISIECKTACKESARYLEEYVRDWQLSEN